MLREDLAGPAQARCRRSRRHRAGRRWARRRRTSSLVMSSRLAMKRLSRSDFVDDGRQQIGLLAVAERVAKGRAAFPPTPSTAASGVLRSCEIEVSSAERRRSVSAVRLARSMSSTRWTRSIASALWSISASSRRRWSGVSSGPGLSLSMPTTPIGAAAGAHRQEQPLGARQRVRAAARRPDRSPTPISRRRGRRRRACPRADSRPSRRSMPFSGSSSTTRTFSIKAV